MNKIEGQYTIKKKWFNNKGKFVIEQQGRKMVGTFTYGKNENKIDMARFNGDHYFEFCGSYKTVFGMKYYSVTGNVEGFKFEGNFENKKGTKKIIGTLVIDGQGAPEAAPAAPAAEAAPEKEEPKAEDEKKSEE